jgi:2-methylcitrate dehydratase PrpD
MSLPGVVPFPAESAGRGGLARLVADLFGAVPGHAELQAADTRLADTALAVRLGAVIGDWPTVRAVVSRLAGPPGRSGVLALALASCGRATEVDDIHLRSCTTPGAVVVPVALACAAAGAPAERVREAIVTGYEAVVSLSEFLGGAPILSRGIWPTLAVAPVAAALTAARASGLGLEETLDAAALAAATVPRGRLPEPARQLSFGLAVLAGVAAAIAAAEGVPGQRRLLETWRSATLAGAEVTPLAGAGRPAAVLDTCVKPFCSARQSLSAVAALRDLSQSDPTLAARAGSVTVGVPGQHVTMVDRHEVTSRQDAIVSLPYQVALAICAPGSLDDVRRSARLGGELAADLMARVNVVADPVAGAAFPSEWGASIALELDGLERQLRVHGVPGERDRSLAAIESKARRLFTASGLAGDEVAAVCELARSRRPAEIADHLRSCLLH